MPITTEGMCRHAMPVYALNGLTDEDAIVSSCALCDTPLPTLPDLAVGAQRNHNRLAAALAIATNRSNPATIVPVPSTDTLREYHGKTTDFWHPRASRLPTAWPQPDGPRKDGVTIYASHAHWAVVTMEPDEPTEYAGRHRNAYSVG